MPDQTPKPEPSKRAKSPASMETAHQFYGSAFEVKDAAELSKAIGEFAELSSGEQRFALAHLLYLNLQAQASAVRLLRELRDTMDEVADSVNDGLEALGEPEEDEGVEDEHTDPGGAQARPPTGGAAPAQA